MPEEASLSPTNARPSRIDILRDYERQRDECDAECKRLEARSRSLTLGRGLLLLGALALLAWGWLNWTTLWWLPGTIVGAAFLIVAAIQENAERLLRNAQTHLRIHRSAIAAMQRDWKNLPRLSVDVPVERQSIAEDLDLVGNASLFRLLCIARTPMGIQTLRDWLLFTPTLEAQAARQEAVRTLAGYDRWRQQMQLHSEQLAASRSGPEAMIEWAESTPWLNSRLWLKWLARFLTLAVVVLLGLLIVGGIDKQWGGIALMAVCAMNFLVTVAFVGTIHVTFNQISSRQNDVAHYRALFRLVDSLPREGSFLRSIHEDASYAGRNAFEQIVLLGRLMQLANLRRSGFLGLFYLLLQFLFLWDFHAFDLLEGWQRKRGQYVRRWFDALGRVEAIASLAKLVHDEPDWCEPNVRRFDSEQAALRATSLGHPLLRPDIGVTNDVTVGPVGTVLLVTGSNMSGKSTLLRAIGVNLVLAQAGATVNATSFQSPLVRIETSMRISDSLNEGVSFFMAELKRLKEVVDLAKQARDESEHGFFYLLDEILQGTNSKERHIAVQEVIKHLMDMRAIGAVSTHDLELATAPMLASHCHPVHFRETIEIEGERKQMSFDYRLREGVATTSNALKLLEMVGLERSSSA